MRLFLLILALVQIPLFALNLQAAADPANDIAVINALCAVIAAVSAFFFIRTAMEA